MKNISAYTVTKDTFDTLMFEQVTTTALRLEVQLPAAFATGIHEWVVN